MNIGNLATFWRRRSVAIPAGVSGLVLFLSLFFTNAHNSPLDELGCHRDPPGGRYHCHAGSLKGRDFTSKDEAERLLASVTPDGNESDFIVSMTDDPRAKSGDEAADENGLPPPPAPAKAVVNQDMLKVVSWKIKKTADKLDYDRIVNILSEVDIAILQELDLDEVGKGPLHITGDILQKRINEKICRAWFRNSSGGKEKFGILWRDSTVGYVDKGGAIREHCGEMAVIVPVKKKKDERGLASALFYSKTQKKMFMLGTVDLNARPGRPDREIPSLFAPVEGSTFPVIVTGDVKYPTQKLKNWSFTGSLTSQAKRSNANIWTRNAVVVRATEIDLYDRFSELKPRDVDNKVSAAFPMLAEVALVAEPDDKIQTLILKSKRAEAPPKRKAVAPKTASVTAAKVPAKDEFDEPNEDIEAEAREADDTDTRLPASPKSKSKAKKKKK